MRLIIDLDGTICSEEKTYSRSMAQVKPGAREYLSRMHSEGHTIIIYSARTWQEYEMTAHWLQTNQIPYHQLILGKPIGDYWIDDRAIAFESWNAVENHIQKKGPR